MFEFAYKLQLLHYNIFRLVLVFTIWTVKIIKMKIPLGSWKLYAKNEIFKNKRCAKYTLEKKPTLIYSRGC